MKRNFTFIFLLSVFAAACGNSLHFWEKYPSDSLMEQRFREHEADFNRLADMFREDAQLSGVNYESAWLDYEVKANIPQQRLDQYRSLFKKLQVEHIGRGRESGNFYLPFWHRDDYYIGSATKYYIYAESPPSPLVDSLDKLQNSGQDAAAFKRISGNWYMHLDKW
jgi:hypothetical protein